MSLQVKIDDTRTEDGYRLVKVTGYGDKDIREVDEALPFGFDSNPVKGMIAILAETPVKNECAIVGYLNPAVLATIGESRMYSTNAAGELQTFIWLKADGTMQIGGDADNMVRYSKLEDAFNELKQDLNNLVTIFNAHVHAVSGASAVATLTPGTPSSADISPAKINEIKTL